MAIDEAQFELKHQSTSNIWKHVGELASSAPSTSNVQTTAPLLSIGIALLKFEGVAMNPTRCGPKSTSYPEPVWPMPACSSEPLGPAPQTCLAPEHACAWILDCSLSCKNHAFAKKRRDKCNAVEQNRSACKGNGKASLSLKGSQCGGANGSQLAMATIPRLDTPNYLSARLWGTAPCFPEASPAQRNLL